MYSVKATVPECHFLSRVRLCAPTLKEPFITQRVHQMNPLLNIKIETRAATQARDQNKSWLL